MNEATAQAAQWGIRPMLFRVGGWDVPAYSVFVLLGITAVVVVYVLQARAQRQPGEHALYLFLAALVGGTLGAKLPIWITHLPQIFTQQAGPMVLLSGRTVVGGLIGGTLAVIATRRALGLTIPMGNLFAPAIALGVAIGRIGCLLRGCCYGVATTLPWGIDFGDGIRRHPTQLYESGFLLALFAYLWGQRKRMVQPGALFQRFMVAYFACRFAVEFVRQEPRLLLGLTAAQWVSAGIIAYYLLAARLKAPARAAATPEHQAPA